jgi:hypothetical protein
MLSSGPFGCPASYPRGKTYTLTLGQVGRAAPLPLESVGVKRDGAFATPVRIPAEASPGEAVIIVKGSPFDQCLDTTSSGSCAGYAVSLTVLPRR